MVSEFTSMPSRREGEIHLGAQPNDLTVSAFELSVFPFSFYFTAQPSDILLLPPRLDCLTRRAGKPSELGRYSDHAKGSTIMASWLGLPAWKKNFLFSRTLSELWVPSSLLFSGSHGLFTKG